MKKKYEIKEIIKFKRNKKFVDFLKYFYKEYNKRLILIIDEYEEEFLHSIKDIYQKKYYQ